MQKTQRFLNHSLSRKLVLAFILVAVPPILIAGKVTTELVNSVINSNVESWLHATTDYIFDALEESENELRAVHTLLHTRFAQRDPAFSQEELKAFAALDSDVIRLRGPAGETLFSHPPIRDIDEQPLFPGSNLRWLTLQDGSREPATVVTSRFPAWDGSMRTLDLANLFIVQISETGHEEPVSIRVFLPQGEDFIQVFSSAAGPLPDVPKKALHSVMAGSGELFLPDRDWTDTTPNAHLLLKAIRDSHGETVAIFAVSAHLLSREGWLPSSHQLFWGFFIVGLLIASCAGYILAKRIVRPVKLLNQGVRSIAAGNLSHRIEVRGHDEIAELSAGFNLMSRQLEAMQRESLESARRDRSRMLGEIALGFAHEIRNPLVVIKTSAELVHSKLPMQSKESRLMGFVVEEVGRIDSLIKEFLSFANPEPITLELFDLHSLVKGALEISAAELAKRRIRHTLTLEAEDCGVLGEQNQIRQVLLNLLMNAMDAMPEGGSLDLRLYGLNDTSRICLEIRDTGTGIPEDVLPTIYLPFTSTKKSGLGLGLAKTQAIIEAHGGSIACSSVPGSGTVFTVCLIGGALPLQTSPQGTGRSREKP